MLISSYPGAKKLVNMDSFLDKYLDLLRRSLTNTIFENEPDIDDDEFRFTMDFA